MKLQPLFSTIMGRHRLRKRSYRYCRCSAPIRYLLIILLGFLITLISFLTTLYVNSDNIFDLISYLFSPSKYKLQKQSLFDDFGENYRPRDFLGKKESLNYDYYIQYNDFNYLQPETLTYESRIYSNNTEILFRLPKKIPTSAVLLIFHSCNHLAYDWFHVTERQRIIGAAVDLGYACLVFQATDKISRCWSNNADIYENEDVRMVFNGLEGFYKEYSKLETLPLFTFGSSSGGIFSSIFAINQLHRIQGQIIFTSIILPEILYTYVKAKNYPATAWIHMLRDIEFASEDRINISMQVFGEHKIPHKNFPIEPVRLFSRTFNERIPAVTSATSQYLFYRLQQNRWLNYHNYLLYNPRRRLTWQAFLFPLTNDAVKNENIFNNINKYKHLITDFLNTIYGEHEISYERSFQALRWLLTSSNRTDG